MKKPLLIISMVLIASLLINTAYIMTLQNTLSKSALEGTKNSPATAAVAIQNKITSYGDEAQTFASELRSSSDSIFGARSLSLGKTAIIISDTKAVDTENLETNLKNGAILVAINLPKENGLVKQPTLQVSPSVEEFAVGNNETASDETITKVISRNGTQIITPEYWIVVSREGDEAFTAVFVTLDDSLDARNGINSLAIDKINSALSPISKTDEGTEHWVLRDTKEFSVTFGSGGANIYQSHHQIYQLDIYDTYINKEFWQVKSWINSYIGTYTADTWHVGPYLYQRTINVNGHSPAAIWDFGPNTTPESSTSSINIGFTVNQGGPGVNIGYSQSWTTEGVRIDVSQGTAWMKWDEGFRLPDYAGWPAYINPPCATSHNSYATTTRVIEATTVGNGFTVNLYNAWNLYDDYIYIIPPGVPFGYRANYPYLYLFENDASFYYPSMF